MEADQKGTSVQFIAEDLWKAIEGIRGAGSPLRLAVAYLSSDERFRLRSGDNAIVDASDGAIRSGQTSAKVLDAAHKIGANLFSHDHLHAKVIITQAKVLVGSANISQRSPSLAEAAIVSSDESVLADANAWWDRLKKKCIKIDPEFIARIKKIAVERNERGRSGNPTLAEALENDLPILRNYLFSWCANDAALSKKTVAKAAKANGLLPPKILADSWTWYECEWQPTPKLLEAIRNTYQGKPAVDFCVVADHPGYEIKRFKAVNSVTSNLIDAFVVKGRIVMLVLEQNAPGLKLNGLHWRRKLTSRLTRGLAKLPSVRKRLANRKTSAIELTELQAIYRAGA